ncbi:GNAT family N-acetyltransferase [Gammaproteobacteria bacterium 45_16_T64]|nr:GNAT family N-acetyltransferase [Gammaproteobacteria bacterium 45_16_T64]
MELCTDRLLLRQWKDDDFAVFAKMNADPQVMEYYPETLGTEASNAMAQKIQGLLSERSWGFWAVETLKDHQFIGFVGLHKPSYDLPVTPCVEIGWRLGKEFWGNGYATEAGSECLRFAFDELDLNEVFSFTSITNTKSSAVMERLGMINTQENFEHPIIPENHPLREHVLFKITQAQWSNKT